jgi:hypothetical protein
MTERDIHALRAQALARLAEATRAANDAPDVEGALRYLAQFIGLCSSLKWSRHWTKSPFLALPATAGSNAAYKIISACSNAVS